MQASPSSNSVHSTSGMYYTNVLFGRPLLSASAAANETTEETVHTITSDEELPVASDDFIDLDVRSDYASNQSGDEESSQIDADPHLTVPSSQFQNMSSQ